MKKADVAYELRAECPYCTKNQGVDGDFEFEQEWGCECGKEFFYKKEDAFKSGRCPVCDYGWISVDERLPEVDREVILYSSGDDGMCIGHRMRYIKKGYGYVESSDLNAVNGVTHWMPRPDSPETE